MLERFSSWKTDREVYVSCHLVLSVIIYLFIFLFVLENLLLGEL